MSNPPTSGHFEGNDRFQVLSLLGRGGMGVVYAVHDRERQTKVALKTLDEGSAVELRRLKAEFRAIQELAHPNLVSLGELFEDQGRWFFTMELVEGGNFIEYIRTPEVSAEGREPLGKETGEDGPSEDRPSQGRRIFDEARLRESLVQLCGALEALHGTQRVHRDIKPENVLVQGNGRVVLLDFGLVAPSEPGQLSVAHTHPVGTAAYMAPEQAASLQVGPEADWYAVGGLLFEALTGTPPFSGTFHEMLQAKHAQKIPRPRDLNPAVPEDLDALCMALLQHEPAKRPRGEDVIRVLRRRRITATSLPMSMVTRLPVFSGRQEALDWILEGLTEVKSKGLVPLLLHGESGIGKSELLRAAGREMLERDSATILLRGRCRAQELAPYGLFTGVVDELARVLIGLPKSEVASLTPRDVEMLVRVFPALNLLSDAETGEARLARLVSEFQEMRSLAFQAFRELVTRLADRRPVVLVLDDLQWVDEDSLKLLRALMQPPDAPALLLVMSLGTPPDEAAATDLVSRFHGLLPARSRDLALGPLSPEASVSLAAELLSDESEKSNETDASAEIIAVIAAGHPLFIQELAHLWEMKRFERSGPAPQLDDVLWMRIGALEEGLRRLVELVSISPVPLRQDLAAVVLGVMPAEVFRMAARLRVLHLVNTRGPEVEDLVEPCHDRVREVVVARLEAAVKVAWHEALARGLRTSRHVAVESLANHLETIGETQQAAEHFMEAADQSAAVLAFDHAAKLYARALRLLEQGPLDPRAPRIRDLRVRLGIAQASAGRGEEGARTLLQAVPGSMAAEGMKLRQQAADQMLKSGHLREGFEVARQVLCAIGIALPRSSVGALVSLLWRRFLLRIRGMKWRERDESQIVPATLVNVDNLRSMAVSLGFTDHIRGSDINTRFLLAALKVGEPRRIMVAMTQEASYASASAPDSAYARNTVDACERILRNLKEPLAKIHYENALALAGHMRGNWFEARKHSELANRYLAGEFYGSSWERGMMSFQYLWSLYYLGEFSELIRRFPALLENARDRGDLFTESGLVLGLCNSVLLNQHGPDRADREIDDLLARWNVDGYHLQHFWALVSKVQNSLYSGHGEKALAQIDRDWKELRRSLLLRLPAIRNEGLHLRARATLAWAAQSEGQLRKDLLKQAKKDIDMLNQGTLPWVRALGQLVEAAYQVQMGDDAAARGCLERAVDQLDEIGLKLYAAAARVRLGTLTGGDAGRTILEQGRAFMTAQGVKEESCMVEMLAPGFPVGDAERNRR